MGLPAILRDAQHSNVIGKDQQVRQPVMSVAA